jgi:glycerophosphoryl diester phosphodiesterase
VVDEMIPETWPAPVAIAHRGSRYLWPENTMAAFSGAIALGYTHIETDLRLTGDGVLVCLHDRDLDRTTNGSGPVSQIDFRELAHLDAGHRHATGDGFSFRGRGLSVPRFEELVISFPSTRIVADLKTDESAAGLVELAERYSLWDRLVVGSFSDRRLEVVRRLSRGRMVTSTGSSRTRAWLLASRWGGGVPGGAAALQVPVQMRGLRVVDSRLVDSAHRHGLHVHVWTVNDQTEMNRLLDLGVDGLVTDRPDLLRQVLADRGQWAS